MESEMTSPEDSSGVSPGRALEECPEDIPSRGILEEYPEKYPEESLEEYLEESPEPRGVQKESPETSPR